MTDEKRKMLQEAGALRNEAHHEHELASVVPQRPLTEWPFWAKALRKLATPEDKGIGDVIARTIGDEKSEAFKAWHLRTFGKPCGCPGRQSRWNRIYSLKE